MKWFTLLLIVQCIMWGASEEPPGTTEGGEPAETSVHAKEKCEQNKNQLESLKEIMLRNKQSLKKKEEEVQEYGRRLSKIKSRAKLSRRSKEGSLPPKDVTQSPKTDAVPPDLPEEAIDDISQAKTPKAKSNLLQKKLAENRKVFEQRSKELTETKRAVEEKVEAIRQQLDEKDVAIIGVQKDQLSVTPVRPIVVTADIMSPIQIANVQEKENKILELNNKILELEATVLDLQENLREKDSVIDSKTRAVTLMSADLSKKGKTTLDTLEDTKDEMRTMQEHFVLLETSLKSKNESLLQQLHERDSRIGDLEETVHKFQKEIDEQKLSESASVDFSRSTMDALVETKDAMKSMQENFVLIESSLKAKNDNLLRQLNDYEIKLAEANERIFTLESGIGIVKSPTIDDLQFKLEKLEQSNKLLQDEKYELQKNIAEMQDKIVNRSVHGNGAAIEKDNRIAELENLIEELKQSNSLLEEESKSELQKQLADVTLKNDEYSNKVNDLEKQVQELAAENNDLRSRLPDEKTASKEDEKVAKLTKELEDLNKSMIKIKAQHRSKVKNLQKQLETFKMVSDTNAELVRLGNQVALLEEEKGNLQLSLVDFDELKASAGDWQERIADLETKVSAQTKEIEMHIEAIAILENQKLDLTQELHTAKQEVSALEAENAESENLRVTAEMKVVDLEEQLESVNKTKAGSESKSASSPETDYSELLKRIEDLTRENSELFNKITKMEEKGVSDSGSTESFEAIHEPDKTLLKKIEELTQKNNQLTLKLNKFEEKGNSHAGSTESFETINDTDKNELLKKIDQLTQENTDLTLKLSRIEEKGSDTGSTESFERIPEHSESTTKIELLTQENSELVIKLTKLEEQLESMETGRLQSGADLKLQVESLLRENDNLLTELRQLRAQRANLVEENDVLQKRIESLTVESSQMTIAHGQLEERILQLEIETSNDSRRSRREVDVGDEIDVLSKEKNILEKEVKELRNALEQSQNTTEEVDVKDLQSKVDELLEDNARLLSKIGDLEAYNEKLKSDLEEVTQEKEKLSAKIQSVSQEKGGFIEESVQRDDDASGQSKSAIVASLEREIADCKRAIEEQTSLMEEMRINLAKKQADLEEKERLIAEYEAAGKKTESLELELREMSSTVEDLRDKCEDLQQKMEILEAGKTSIEEKFKLLQNENEMLLAAQDEKDFAISSLKQHLESNVTLLEANLKRAMEAVSAKDEEIVGLQELLQQKDRELNAKYTQLQSEMITIDNLQDELNSCKVSIQEKDSAFISLSDELENLNKVLRSKEEEIDLLRTNFNDLNDELETKNIIIRERDNKIEADQRELHDFLSKIDNLHQEIYDTENQLSAKKVELDDLKFAKEQLEKKIAEQSKIEDKLRTEIEYEKSDAQNRVQELQSILENNAGLLRDVHAELKNAYDQMERLKIKHTEDTEMQNQKLESVLEDMISKTNECEALKADLQEKERLLGENLTEEIKVALESKIVDLEQTLVDAESKMQAQFEKMKKIAATLKKKTVMCQELEARVAELEEKWTTEKDEKEAKNKRIQEVEVSMREKDNKIAELEEKLAQARNDTAEALKTIETLTNELSNSKEKISVLTQQLAEMDEEIIRLRGSVEAANAEVQMEKGAKENVAAEYESYKREIERENESKQLELEEVTEKARELSVRMQVMEDEYVEQLALIKNLRAENALLLSRQTQIYEKLENAEKESEERRVLIEKLEKEIVNTVTATTQTPDEETDDETRTPGSQHCDHCEQCQTLVQALEAKLQEREAEIDNLDNELANSIGNFVQMRESLRFNDMMNQTAMRNRTLEDPYNDLLFQYNALTASNEEIKERLSEMLKANKELEEKLEGLQSANATLEENLEGLQSANATLEDKLVAAERESEENKSKAEMLQASDSQNADLTKKSEELETELASLRMELQAAQERTVQLEQQLNSQLSSFECEKEQLLEKQMLLVDAKNSLEKEIESLKANAVASRKSVENFETESAKEAADRPSDEGDNAPRLFDASKIFGSSFASDPDVSKNTEMTRLQSLLEEREVQCFNLTQEIEHLQRLMVDERSQMSQNYSYCSDQLKVSQENLHAARAEQERLQQLVAEKSQQIDALSVELNNSLQIMAEDDLRNDTDKLKHSISEKDGQIEELRAELNATRETLDQTLVERDQRNHQIESYKLQLANLEAELRNSTETELIQELENRISVTVKERDLLQLQVNDLSRSLEELKDSLEVRRNLQVEVEEALRQRDEAREVVANLTQALESREHPAEGKTQNVSVELAEPVSPEGSSIPKAADPKSAEENVERVAHLGVGSSWDAGSSEKLNVDEETWGWNEDDVQVGGEQNLIATLTPSLEVQLRMKVDDLEDRIKDLEAEKDRIAEENKVAQLRSGKMIKKLKEYKVQIDNLQQQLKAQKSASGFYDLDSAIEEELKSQISKLEKTLSEAKEEQKNVAAEREGLVKRLDVVVAANERYMEMKERQDMDMEVLRIRNKELSEKIEVLQRQLESNLSSVEAAEASEDRVNVSSSEHGEPVPERRKRSVEGDEDSSVLLKKYKDEIDDLKDELEALAAENEQLQHFLEEQKAKFSTLETKRTADQDDSIQIVDELNKKISELQGMLSKSREEYDLLRKQYEQSLMDANDQVSAMRQNTDFLKAEAVEKIGKLEMEISDLRQNVQTSDQKAYELQTSLENVLREKANLEEQLANAVTSTELQLSSSSASMAEITELLNIRIQEVADLKQELQRQYFEHEDGKARMQAAIEELNQELVEKKQNLEALRQSFSDKENELIQQQSVETVSALVSQATQELVQKHAIEVEEKDKQLRSLNEKIATLESAMDEYLLEGQSKASDQLQEFELMQQQLLEKDSHVEQLKQLLNKHSELSLREEELQRRSATVLEEKERLNDDRLNVASADVQKHVERIQSLEKNLEDANTSLSEKQSILERYEQESKEYQEQLTSCKGEIDQLRGGLQEIDVLRSELRGKTEQLTLLNSELENTNDALEETRRSLGEKVSMLEITNQLLNEKQTELDRVSLIGDQHQHTSSGIIDGLPLFRMTDDSQSLQGTVDLLNVELQKRHEEIEHLKYILSENTYPGIIQEMQERINCLYNEKAELESSLELSTQRLTERDQQYETLKEQSEMWSQELVSKEESSLLARERRSAQEQEEIVRLQNELHVKQQEINELKYVIAEKDSQLSLQASMEPNSDDFELRETVQRLTAEVYGKEQEVQHLRSTISELQKEVLRLEEIERHNRDVIERLTLEKEQVQMETQQLLERKLQEKEMEIDEIKQRLFREKQSLLDDLQLRDKDVENLRRQLEDSSVAEQGASDRLHRKEEELLQVNADLAEKERRLAELSITKDAELHNLKVQIHEKDVRIEELIALSEEEEKQLVELRNSFETKEAEINALNKLLENKVKEYELIQGALTKDVPITGVPAAEATEDTTSTEDGESTSQKLDFALYVLHQRDVRIEELTHELMQLLEERDTLQLRLSSAIRVNEELRRTGSSDFTPKEESSSPETDNPLVEHPSPSKSDGPVEIAREAIDAPVGEDKEALALKLSQLHTVSHTKDVRLRDERELRHTQQMSLLAHKDVLSTLPPEAAARLVNANYTLSRDVQSQSSVLLNWLWGKSTPKVVHM